MQVILQTEFDSLHQRLTMKNFQLTYREIGKM
jgi:hypothetical protein